jgi:uncharacterized protein (TIGR04255 family)
VLDVDCDMPPALDLGTLEAAARDLFRDRYPKFRAQFLQQHTIQAPVEGSPQLSVRRGLQAFQFLQDDERQLVQVRTAGFSFNRLAPYTSLDDYLPEIERAWGAFVGLASPLQARQVRLRYINRILLPLAKGQVNLDRYLAIGPRLPEERRLTFLSFLHRHAAAEKGTGNRVNTTLASQPVENERLPVILDIEAAGDASIDPKDWPSLGERIQALRSLKNLVFQRTLTGRCLKLF